MRHDTDEEALKLELLKAELELGFRDLEANRFSTRSIADIGQSVLDEVDTENSNTLVSRPLASSASSANNAHH